jgi:hypothetical protein
MSVSPALSKVSTPIGHAPQFVEFRVKPGETAGPVEFGA